MKNAISLFLLTLCLLGCKKKTEILEDLVVQAMTTGQWKITSFQENGVDRTADFSPYRFKYNTDNTVNAIKNGAIEKTGTWNGNASTMSIVAEFPNATQPLLIINGTWNITRNGWSFVEANILQSGTLKTLRLDRE
jgi:hypothetical protein